MTTPVEASMQELCSVAVNDLDLWQTFLLGLWLLCHLLHRLAGSFADWLRQCLLSSFVGSETRVQEQQVESSLVQDRCDELELKVQSETGVASSCSDLSAPKGTLIPSLPNEVVKKHIWPVLVSSPSVSQLLSLYRLSAAWSQFIESTIEWQALVFVLRDSPGYYRYTMRNQLRYRSPSERLGFEISHFRCVISERMNEIEDRLRGHRLRKLPICVSMGDCPPTVDECSSFYSL